MTRPLIVHVITRLELGGAQENTLDTCRLLDRSTFRVALLAGPGGVLDEEARRIPDLEFRTVPSLVREIAPLSDLRACWWIRRALRELAGDGGPALVHTHSSKAGIVGRAAARVSGLPAIHTVHGFGHAAIRNRLVRRIALDIERMQARSTARFVAVSRANEAEGRALRLFGEPPRPVTLVRSGFDVDRFRSPRVDRSAARARLGIPPGVLLVGTISAMKPQKALDVWLSVARGVLAVAPLTRFVIVGDGPDRGALERRRRELGLDDAVTFLGARDDVAEILPALDAFLLTSRWEGLPRALVQAMAANVPCVVTAAGGNTDVVADGVTGMLAPIDDVPTLTAKLAQVLADPALGRSLAERAALQVDEFDVRAMVRALEQLYRDVFVPGFPALAAPDAASR